MTNLSIFQCLLLIWMAFVSSNVVETSLSRVSSGFIGCHFNAKLCSQIEVCVDDGLFGQCQSTLNGKPDLYRFDLTAIQSAELDSVMKRLKKKGYKLSHDYTQCVLTCVLFSYRHHTLLNLHNCDHYIETPRRRNYFYHRSIVHADQPTDELHFDDETELAELSEWKKFKKQHNNGKLSNLDGAGAADAEAQLYAEAIKHLTSAAIKLPETDLSQEMEPKLLPMTESLQPTDNNQQIQSTSSNSQNHLKLKSMDNTAQQSMPVYLIVVFTAAAVLGTALVVAAGVLIYIYCCSAKPSGDEASIKKPFPWLSPPSITTTTGHLTTTPWIDESLRVDNATKDFTMEYMKVHLKDKVRLESDWSSLNSHMPEQSLVVAAHHPANVSKNRCPDIVPYEHSRVHLIANNNANESDYINASIVTTDFDVHNSSYIVTQGPLPHTVTEFWQMVWEQGSVIIINLTSLTESSHRYWPDLIHRYHIYEVKLESEHTWSDDYCVRNFTLRNTQSNETRPVTQFHFLSWLEDKPPTSPDALLDFRRKVNNSFYIRSSPIVIHCSDGAGRSGTYCLIDMILRRIGKGAKQFDVHSTLQHIRNQRRKMVKTLEQLEFALYAVTCEVMGLQKPENR